MYFSNLLQVPVANGAIAGDIISFGSFAFAGTLESSFRMRITYLMILIPAATITGIGNLKFIFLSGSTYYFAMLCHNQKFCCFYYLSKVGLTCPVDVTQFQARVTSFTYFDFEAAVISD